MAKARRVTTSPRKSTRRRRTSTAGRRKKTSSSKTVLQVKKGVRNAVYGFYSISLVFLLLLMGSVAFLAYQWKNFQITEYSKEIQQLKAEILRLNSEKSRREALINSELMEYHRIARLAREKLGLKPAAKEPVILSVDKNKLEYYVQKDAKADKPKPE
ncbi:MAG: hypothetical protein D6748_08525 [Calditrichaeota bacterium]|nr:MAG: hypothetical protein D6748_08525 [Calditrichota bacterium]